MQKRILIAVAAILAVVLVVLIWFMLRDRSASEGDVPFFERFSRPAAPVPSVLHSGDPGAAMEFLERLSRGEVIFVWELWALRALCPEELGPDACDEAILKDLADRYGGSQGEELVQLFKKYFEYEATMRETQISADLSFQEKYDQVRKKRREILGDASAKLIFGPEEAQVQFIDASARLQEQMANLSGDERVRQYEALKRETYGWYYDAIVRREDPYNHYELEKGFREADFQKLPAAEREAATAALQEKYFGKEGRERIARAQAEAAREEEKLVEYEKKAAAFVAANPNLSAEAKEKQLHQLRVELLGEEEAAAYLRRREFEEAVKEIK